MPGGTLGGRRIELYVRTLEPRPDGAQSRALDSLEELVERGGVAGYEVVVWGERAPASPADARTAHGQLVHDRLAAFREWGRENDAAIGHGFERRDVESRITGENYCELVLPRLALAVYRDGHLSRVVPYRRDGGVVTVEEFLDALADGAVDETAVVDYGPVATAGGTLTGRALGESVAGDDEGPAEAETGRREDPPDEHRVQPP